MSDLGDEIKGLASKFNIEAPDVERVVAQRKDEALQSVRGDDVWFRFYNGTSFTVTSNPQGRRLKESFMFREDGSFDSLDAYAKGIGGIYL